MNEIVGTASLLIIFIGVFIAPVIYAIRIYRKPKWKPDLNATLETRPFDGSDPHGATDTFRVPRVGHRDYNDKIR